MKKTSLFLARLSAVWIVLLILAEYVIAERNPITAFITYMPQQPLILPVIGALLAALLARQWKHVIACIVMAALFVFLFLGLRFVAVPGHASDFRIMTINVARSVGRVAKFMVSVNRERPDILFMQEANAVRESDDFARAVIAADHTNRIGWHVARIADVAILSQRPLTHLRDIALIPDSGRRVLVAQTIAGGRKVTIACVHLPTSMPGASRASLLAYLASSAESRMIEVQKILDGLPSELTIIAGDFNLPPRGLAYWMITRRYANSFAAARGFGYTYPARLPLMRIDHVFTTNDMAPMRWRTINTGASDHLAVIVDVAFKR